MVQNTRAAKGAGGVRPLGLPQPVEVRTDQRGWPAALKLDRRWVAVTVEDRWRIDDEWWRDDGVSRMYFDAVLANGFRCVLFCDLQTNPQISQIEVIASRSEAEARQSPPLSPASLDPSAPRPLAPCPTPQDDSSRNVMLNGVKHPASPASGPHAAVYLEPRQASDRNWGQSGPTAATPSPEIASSLAMTPHPAVIASRKEEIASPSLPSTTLHKTTTLQHRWYRQ